MPAEEEVLESGIASRQLHAAVWPISLMNVQPSGGGWFFFRPSVPWMENGFF